MSSLQPKKLHEYNDINDDLNNLWKDGISSDKSKSIINNIISNTKQMESLVKNISVFIWSSPGDTEKKRAFTLLMIIATSIHNSTSNDKTNIISYVLAAWQENISSENQSYIIDVFSKWVRANLDWGMEKESELLNGFCLFNLKQSETLNQDIGLHCLQKFILLSDISKCLSVIWESWAEYWANEEGCNTDLSLQCTYDVIETVKGKFENYATMALYKIWDYLSSDVQGHKIKSLEIIKILIIHCRESMLDMKEQIWNFWDVLIGDDDTKVQQLCNEIQVLLDVKVGEEGKDKMTLEDILKDGGPSKDKKSKDLPIRYSSEYDNDERSKKKKQSINSGDDPNPRNIQSWPNKSKNSKIKNNTSMEDNNQIRSNNQNRIESVISATPVKQETPDNDTINHCEDEIAKVKHEYESQISYLLSQMKDMSDKHIYWLDVIENLQKSSKTQLNLLNQRIEHLERNIKTIQKQSSNRVSSQHNEEDNNINTRLNRALTSGKETVLLNELKGISFSKMNEIEINLIEDIWVRLCTMITREGKDSAQWHDCITFIKCVIYGNNRQESKINTTILRNLKDSLEFVYNRNINKASGISEGDFLDLSLIISYWSK